MVYPYAWSVRPSVSLDLRSFPVIRRFEDGRINPARAIFDQLEAQGLLDERRVINIGEDQKDGKNVDVRSYTYRQIRREANRLANVLVDMGVAPGDMVVIYMSTDIKGLVAQLAATLVGATYHFVFGAKGPDIFSDTVHNMGAKVIVTEDGYRVGDRSRELKKDSVDVALSRYMPQGRLPRAPRGGAFDAAGGAGRGGPRHRRGRDRAARGEGHVQPRRHARVPRGRARGAHQARRPLVARRSRGGRAPEGPSDAGRGDSPGEDAGCGRLARRTRLRAVRARDDGGLARRSGGGRPRRQRGSLGGPTRGPSPPDLLDRWADVLEAAGDAIEARHRDWLKNHVRRIVRGTPKPTLSALLTEDEQVGVSEFILRHARRKGVGAGQLESIERQRRVIDRILSAFEEPCERDEKLIVYDRLARLGLLTKPPLAQGRDILWDDAVRRTEEKLKAKGKEIDRVRGGRDGRRGARAPELLQRLHRPTQGDHLPGRRDRRRGPDHVQLLRAGAPRDPPHVHGLRVDRGPRVRPVVPDDRGPHLPPPELRAHSPQARPGGRGVPGLVPEGRFSDLRGDVEGRRALRPRQGGVRRPVPAAGGGPGDLRLRGPVLLPGPRPDPGGAGRRGDQLAVAHRGFRVAARDVQAPPGRRAAVRRDVPRRTPAARRNPRAGGGGGTGADPDRDGPRAPRDPSAAVGEPGDRRPAGGRGGQAGRIAARGDRGPHHRFGTGPEGGDRAAALPGRPAPPHGVADGKQRGPAGARPARRETDRGQVLQPRVRARNGRGRDGRAGASPTTAATRPTGCGCSTTPGARRTR